MHHKLALFLLTLTAALLSVVVTPCPACIILTSPSSKFSISDEMAVIIWDKETKTEHFIRQAIFKGEGPADTKHLGFVVPTPTVPTLQEADPEIFKLAHYVARTRVYPPIEYYSPFTYTFRAFLIVILLLVFLLALTWILRATGRSSPLEVGIVICFLLLMSLAVLRQLGTTVSSVFSKISPSFTQVDVLKRQQVAGMDAVILQASDPKALGEWLRANGFEVPPGDDEWLARYVADKWIFTAFKIAVDSPEESGRTAKQAGTAVRMSFTAEAPFYPYAEPQPPSSSTSTPQPSARPAASASSRYSDEPARKLRVAVLTNERVQGIQLKDLASAPSNQTLWPAKVLYSDTLAPAGDALELPPGETVYAERWISLARLMNDPIASRFPTRLTYFEDTSAIRTLGDLAFIAAADQSAYRDTATRLYVTPHYIFIGDNFFLNALAVVTVLATIAGSWYLCRAIILVRTQSRQPQPA